MRYRTTPALVLLALTGSLAAGCSSSSRSAPPSSAPSPTTAAASASASGAGGALPAADCAVIKPIAGTAITTLTPMQTMPTPSAAAAMGQYVGQLNSALAKLTSAQAKTDLGAFISALGTSNSTTITSALGKLGADCP